MEWKYNESKTQIILPGGKPKRTLKVTGTRFASILGLNPWSSPFQMWCEITKSAKLPFVDNKYTIAGKVIEPKVIQYFKDNLYKNTLDPEEFFGPMVYRSIQFDFYKGKHKYFGGMWDAVMTRKDKTTMRALVEIKTSSKPQDWVDGPPMYYLLQVCLYAWLSGVDDFYLSATFLKDEDYQHPEEFVVTEKNTTLNKYKLSEMTFPVAIDGEMKVRTFDELVEYVDDWYNKYVVTGVSPEFNEQVDADFLKILRKSAPKNDNDITTIIGELNKTQDLIEQIKKDRGLDELEKRAKTLKDNLKIMMKDQCGENDTNIQVMNWSYAKTKDSVKVDEKALKADGLFDKYSVTKPGTWRLTQKKVEE